jgi:hypothetical protein
MTELWRKCESRKCESPETTCGYEGFYAPMSIEGSIERAKPKFERLLNI